MTRVPEARGRVPAPLVDIGLVLVALIDMLAAADLRNRLELSCAILACAALMVRRRMPLLVVLLTAPAFIVSYMAVATQIALYTLAARSHNRTVLVCCVGVFTSLSMLPWPDQRLGFLESASTLAQAGYGLANAAAPVFLGQMVQARRELTARLTEITEAREHERLLTAQNLLARERAQLAREMHDVVSHQVSLIAVRAGALQVDATDPDTTEAATTIRRLSAQTLDELRHMVRVLRGSGDRPTELTPQPTLAQLHDLVANSGIDTRMEIDLPGDLPPPVQRAIYRTVQEALTNARKHAPGATATVRIHRENGGVRTTVVNTVPTRPALALPSAHHGLTGLRQRAELLGGTLEHGPTPDHGYRLQLDLPAGCP